MIELAVLPLVLAPFIAVAMARRWRTTIFFVMIIMVFEGAVRKWVFPGLQGAIYFVKDILIVVAVVGFLLEDRRRGVHEPLLAGLKVLLAVNLAFCFLQIGNPNSPSPLLGILGLKAYMLYAMLLFMVPHAFRSIEDLEHKLKIYMLLMIPVALLGVIQFASPADSWINAQVTHDIDKETFVSRFGEDDRARASGTFANIGGFATFIEAMVMFALAYMLSRRGYFRKNWVPFALLTTSILGMFATGSRSAVWGALGMAFVTALLCIRAGLVSGATTLRLAVGGAVMALVLTFTAQEAVDAFQHRASNADDPIMRLLSPITELLSALEVSPIIGMGIGTNSNASVSLMGSQDLWWLQGNLFELETARVVQEVGLFGFMLVYAVRIALLLVAIRMVTRLRTPLFKALSAAIAGFYVLHLALFVINNPTAGLYYWFSAGLLFAMYRLDYERVPVPVQGQGHAASVPRATARWPS